MSIPPITHMTSAAAPPPPEPKVPPPDPVADDAAIRPSQGPARPREAPPGPSLEEAVTRAVATARNRRRRLAHEVRHLPPPLDTRLALLASVAELRTAIVPPSLTTLDRRR